MKTEYSHAATRTPAGAMRWADEPLNGLLLTLAGTGVVATLTIASALLTI